MPGTLTISAQLDGPAYRAALARVRQIPGGFRRIIPPALNRTLASTATLVDRQIRSQLNVKKARVKARMASKRASAADPSASVRFSPKRFSLASFRGVRWSKRRGVTVTVRAGHRVNIPEGFVRNLRRGDNSEYQVVFRRVKRGEKYFGRGKATKSGAIVRRLPVLAPKGPSLAYVWTKQRGMIREVERRIPQMLVREIYSKIAYVTRRAR